MAQLKHLLILSLLAIIALSTAADALTYSERIAAASAQSSERRITSSSARPTTSSSSRLIERAQSYSAMMGSLGSVSAGASQSRQSGKDLSRSADLRQPQRVLGDYTNRGLSRAGYTSEAASRFRTSTPGYSEPTGQSSVYGTARGSSQRTLGSYSYSAYGSSTRRFVGSTYGSTGSSGRAPTIADRVRSSGSYFSY